ncbi:MAG: hypothetical protein AAGA66_21410 [Bacteroidota bacterium]
MRKSYRYVIYFLVGLLIYQVIESGKTGLTYEGTRTTLIVGIIVVFILLVIVRMIKQRYEDK